jgi:S-adenosylmethionine synthetase
LTGNSPRPQVVVHCLSSSYCARNYYFSQTANTLCLIGAANRQPDACENNPEQARRINVEATQSLAELTSSRDILLIYISTDYVFPGVEGEAPYETDAEPKPTNIYGQMKRDGEVAVLDVTKTSGLGVVLRVPVLYGPSETNGESAVNTILDAVDKARNADAGLKMDDWAQRFPTNTQDVGRVCNDIAVRYIKDRKNLQSLPKILHFSAEERMTKYEIAQRLAKILGVEIPGMIANKQGNDPNAAVQRPYNTQLSTKVLKETGINVKAVGFDEWWLVSSSIPFLSEKKANWSTQVVLSEKIGCIVDSYISSV